MVPPPVVGRPLSQVAMAEAKRNWPFVFGFAVTGYLVTNLTASLNPDDAKKSPFVNIKAHR